MKINKISQHYDSTYNDDNPYLEDALPCPECGEVPYERIVKCPCWSICGIPVDGGYGTALMCDCRNETRSHEKPWKAYIDWNHWVQNYKQ
jgi:hypothetical protein